jgi:hypothetical protein
MPCGAALNLIRGLPGSIFLLRFREKGGKEKELPVHHKLDEYLKVGTPQETEIYVR